MSEIIIKSLDFIGIESAYQIPIGILIVLFFAYAGNAIGQLKERRRHQKREFSDFWIAQRNIVDDNSVLKLRTVSDEQSLKALFSDPILISKVKKAAKLTDIDNPWVTIDKEDDHLRMWLEVVNTISSRMPAGATPHVISITRERYKSMQDPRQRNIIRILLIPELDLKKFLEEPLHLNLEKDKHQTRIRTLKSLAEIWFKHKGKDPKTNKDIAALIEAPW